MQANERFRVVADYVSHFRDHKGNPRYYTKKGEVVTLLKEEPHNCMVLVEGHEGTRFGIHREYLTPISKSLF